LIAQRAFAAGLVAAAVALFGCGGGNDTTAGGGAYGGGTTSGAETSGGNAYGSAQKTTGAPSGGGAAAVVQVAQNPKLGPILVDSRGYTLYDFHKDQGGKSSCYGACAQVWPPLTGGGAPKAQKGAKASLLETTKRSDGSEQVTYAGHPLYTYQGDSQPGQANGNDFSQFGAQWYALTPSGGEPSD
jgi:predicted lipoprotein with Yx(FWY)xxD motif